MLITKINLSVGFLLLFILPAAAQLSPGDLHRSHAFLEGLTNCTKCHSAGKQIVADNCLACHKILAGRIREGRGLHANPEFRTCIDCHSEHHGRNFALIYWKEGMDALEHQRTGYRLEGAHTRLECRDCHTEKNIADIEVFRAAKKDPNRTLLGLSANCGSCHRDEHRGQLGNNCLDCHNNETWKPVSGFDHAKTGFALTGEHSDLKCQACHKVQRDKPQPDDPTYLKFANMKFAQCGSCHTDPHNGSFGANCKDCHQTSGWQRIRGGNFDHSKTRFPLEGKHLPLACESCHKPGKPRRGIAFANCSDCHGDVHQGQFAGRAQNGECRECHDVNGFKPAKFGFEEHGQTDFPLQGAHLAVPCLACHTGAQSATAGKGMISMNRFTFQSMNCQDCHREPHLGQTDQLVAANPAGCLHCHQIDSWRSISFDHQSTGFELVGRHASANCIDCHQPTSGENGKRKLPFEVRTRLCVGCHNDIHEGQFDRIITVKDRQVAYTDCERCHSPNSWAAENFDHNRDSRFNLQGAHQEVPCESCHKTQQGQKLAKARFKPLDTSCQSCHGGGKTKEGP